MTQALRSSLDRALVGSPLRRSGVAAAVLAAVALMLLAAEFQFVGQITRMRSDVERVFLTALGLSLLATLVPIAILRFLDRREREAPWALLSAFLWGGIIATGWSVPFNTALLGGVARWVARHPEVGQRLGSEAAWLLGAPLAAPLVEELIKGLGLLLFFTLLRAEFDNMRDGFIYGALIGVGFNWLETAVWVTNLYVKFGFAPWGMQFGARYALFGLGGHAMFTGLFGAALGLARQTRRRWLRLVAPLVGLGLALTAHAWRNSLALLMALASRGREGAAPASAPGPPPDYAFVPVWLGASLFELILFAPFLIVLLVAVWRSGVWERRVIREELRDEVGELVTAEEYERIEADRMFRTRRIDRLDRRRSAALVNAQHELAFRKRRVRGGGGDPEADPLVLAWRAEIRGLR